MSIPFQTATTVTPSESEFGADGYQNAVRRAKEYIAAGDVMQVVLSQRMRRPFTSSPLSLYRALRSLNPSPYMFYYDFGDFHVVGASPEILVRKEGATVTLRPIAGTRPRGATREADEALARELLADPKEIAEHVMLVDLGRNDVGRVAQIGTVKLTDRMVIERYSHVMHIVSNVEGTLKPGLTSIDVLRAAFPAGTVSGAPKVRAMQIIDELEPSKRGVYAGAVGYVSFQDDMDTAIAIRTAVVKDGMLYAQAGAGHRPRLGARVGVDRRRRTRRAPCCAPPRWCSRDSTRRRERVVAEPCAVAARPTSGLRRAPLRRGLLGGLVAAPPGALGLIVTPRRASSRRSAWRRGCPCRQGSRFRARACRASCAACRRPRTAGSDWCERWRAPASR